MKSAQELALELGVSQATLRNYRAEAGIAAKTRSAKYNDSEIAQIKAIAQSKHKPITIAIAQPPETSASDTANTSDTASVTRISASVPGVQDMGDFMPKPEGAFLGILERLESIESKIDGLHALLDKAVIASRYVSRADVESATGKMPAIPHVTRPKRGNGEVPFLREFATLHGVNPRTALDHVRMGLIVTKDVPLGNGKSEHYVTKEQQAGIVAYWKSIRYPFTPCALCPHTEESAASE